MAKNVNIDEEKPRGSYIYYRVKVVDAVTSNPIQYATVSFSTDNGVFQYSTDAEGFATHTEVKMTDQLIEDEQVIGDGPTCECIVSADGYGISDPVDVVGDSSRPKLYATIELEKLPDRYFYRIRVKDKKTGRSISGATVEYSQLPGTNHPDIGETDRFGRFLYTNEDGVKLWFRVKKNGYVDSDRFDLDGTQDISEILQINLEPTTLAEYYYTIAVNDASGHGIEGAKVRLYSDFTLTDPYSMDLVPVLEADDEILCTVCEVLANVLDINPETISADDELDHQYGVDITDAQNIINAIDNTYNMDTPLSDFFTFGTVGDYVQYIKENTPYPYLEKTIYTTDENGLISYRTQASRPNPIYAKGFSLPLDNGTVKYTWGDVKSGKVVPTLSATIPGLTFIVASYSVQTYYYNFRIVDEQTRKPVYGASVTYMNGDEVLTQKTSTNMGLVQFYCKMSSVTVTIEKSGYDTYDKVTFPGSTVSSDIYDIYLGQRHSIQVVDYLGNPVGGVPVTIFQYDNSNPNRKLSKGTHTTYETGYIDCLGDDIYTEAISTPIYAGVLGYDKENEVLGKLIKQLVGMTRKLIITLSEGVDIDEPISNDFETFNDMSINGIKNRMEKNEVDYNKNKAEKIDFKIKIIDPDSVNTYDILTCSPVMVNNNNKSIVGSVTRDMKSDVNDLKIKVLNRYSGYYNPIFKDILFYNDYTLTDAMFNMTKCPFSNTEFDYNYEDNYGKFGVIDNMWFHKVNDDGTKIINTLNPYYPLIGQYAIDKRPYRIFESNWDKGHYVRQVSVNESVECANIVSMKDGKCMFGSKYLNVPDMIEICGVSMGDEFNDTLKDNINSNDMSWKEELSWSGQWNDDWITNPDACPGEMMFKEVNDNSVDFYFFFKKRILRYFREMLRVEFSENISDEFSFGRPGIDDDIDEYICKNVLKLYRLDKVRMFVRRTKKGQHNSRIENDYTSYLQYIPNQGQIEELSKDNLGYFKSHGFVEVNNVTLTKMNTDTFDRKLVYNLRNGCKEDFGFSFILKKI